MKKYFALLLTLLTLSSSALFGIRDIDLMEEKRIALIKLWEDLNEQEREKLLGKVYPNISNKVEQLGALLSDHCINTYISETAFFCQDAPKTLKKWIKDK